MFKNDHKLYCACRGNGSWSHEQRCQTLQEIATKGWQAPLFKNVWQCVVKNSNGTGSITYMVFLCLYLYTDTWHIMGPVQWHIGIADTKVVLQLSSKLHWLLNCPLFFFFFFFLKRKKIYIENNTTYSQIHFQVILFWLHRGENKCSI